MINYYLAQMMIEDNLLEAVKERLINKVNLSKQIHNRKRSKKLVHSFGLI
jgi:hypothetical protein